MTTSNGRRKFSGEEKMAILRRHLVEKMPVSDVCDESGINPTLFYRWQKDLFEHGAAAFERRSGGRQPMEDRQNRKPSKKGTGFEQPIKAHEHWHVDGSYINVCRTFYYLCSVLDGFSRFIVHWEIREAMKERDIEIILQRGCEAFPNV